MLRGFQRKQGTGLRHTIAYGIWKADFTETALYLPGKRSASDEDGLQPAAKRLQELFAKAFEEGYPEVGDPCCKTNQLRLYLGLVELFHHQRYRDHDAGLNLCAGLHEK